jgi:hypothetical protein
MDESTIAAIVAHRNRRAARARGGLDVIELHGAHGYLILIVPLADLEPPRRPLWRQLREPHPLPCLK